MKKRTLHGLAFPGNHYQLRKSTFQTIAGKIEAQIVCKNFLLALIAKILPKAGLQLILMICSLAAFSWKMPKSKAFSW